MKYNFKDLLKRNITSIISCFIVFLFLFVYMLFAGIEPFGKNSFVSNDCLQYVYPFLMVLRNKILSGDSLLYYWNNALGDGFLPTYWYTLSSPINLLVVFVDKYSIRDFINFSIAIRIILSAGSFGYFISRRNKEDSYIFYNIALSCAYALSGYIIGYYNQSMWLDAYVIFPIIMYGYDKLIKERKPLVYIISLVITAYCNFFMVFMIGIFLILWFLLDDHESVNRFFKDLLYFIISSLLALGLSAFSIVITLYSLFDTRVSVTEKLNHEWFGSIFLLIRKLFFLSTPVVMDYNNSANLYIGTVSIIMVLIYFLSDRFDVFEKIRKGILIIILFLSMNESILNYIWHGFHYQVGAPNRFSFILIFLLLTLSSDSMNDITSPIRCCIGLILTEVCLFVTFFCVDLDTIIDDRYSFVILIILIMICALFVILYSYKKKRIILSIICLLMIAETITYASMTLKYASSDITDYDVVMKRYDEYISEYNDDSFYRSVLINGVNENDGPLYGLYGFSSFNGFMNTHTQSFLNSIGFQNAANVIDEKGGGYPLIYDIFGVKEIACTDEKSIECFDIPVVYRNSDLCIYHNTDALSLGMGIEKDKSNTDYIVDEYNKIENINRFIYLLSGYDNAVEEINPQYALSGSGYEVAYGEADNLVLYCNPIDDINEKSINISFISERSGYYNTNLFFDDFTHVTVYVDDSVTRREYIQDSVVLSLGYIEEGSMISIQIESDNTLNKSHDDTIILDMHMAVTDEDIYNSIIDTLKSNQMQTKFYKSDHFSAKINLSDEQVLFTTIPYDEGWHIYENGKELKKQRFADTFIMLDISKGDHELEFKYVPKGFYLSIIVTFVSLIIFILLIIVYKKHNNSLP